MPGAGTWSRTRPQSPQGAATIGYLLEQKSDTTKPERHFLQEEGAELGLAPVPGTPDCSGSARSPLTCPAPAPERSRCSARPRGEAAAAPRSPPPPGRSECWKTRGDSAAGVGEDRHWCLGTSGAWIPQEKEDSVGQGRQSGGVTAMESPDTEPSTRDRSSCRRGEWSLLWENPAVVTFGSVVQSLNH